jgi:parallel beta helix pectate lyase-like protein
MHGCRRLKHAALVVATVLVTAAVRLHAAPQSEAAPTVACDPGGNGNVPPADAIQACIDRAPASSIVEIPVGKYVLNHQVVVSTAITLRGAAGSASSCVAAPDDCVVLVAAPAFADQWGLLVVRSTTNASLERLVIDGNRAERTDSAAARSCVNGDNTYGFNAGVFECEGCRLDDVVSRNAVCGTGMVWTGGNATIEHSAFVSNGDAATPSMWSDGLTLLSAPRSTIRENTFENNSDVGLIIGHGIDSRLEHNSIRQRTQPAFAGLMLDNFNSNDRDVHGDFRGAVIANNTIECGAQLCTFGIQVGPRPWYASNNIVGGELHDNVVKGAKIGINVDGAGDRDAPTAIFSNSVEPAPLGSYFATCAQPIPAPWMNIAPTSIVDRRNEETKAGSHLSDFCQLSSDLAVDQ